MFYQNKAVKSSRGMRERFMFSVWEDESDEPNIVENGGPVR